VDSDDTTPFQVNPPSGVFSVMAYGAVGDGVTDDTAAIQAALTAGAGGTVLLPPATYLLAAEIGVPDNTILSGYGATLKHSAGVGHIMVRLFHPTGSQVHGVTIDLNKVAVTDQNSPWTNWHTGLLVDAWTGSVTDVTIRDVTVNNGYTFGINSLVNSGTHQIVFDNVTITECNIGLAVTTGPDVPTEISVTGGSFSGNVQAGLEIAGGTGQTVTGVNSSGNGEHGIVMGPYASQFTIQGCVFNDNGHEYESAGSGIVTTVGSHHFTITGNVCIGNEAHGITIDTKDDTETQIEAFSTVSNNVCSRSVVYHGIYVTYSRYVTVSGNVCEGNAHSGILLACTNATVIGNELVNNAQFGVWVGAAATAVPLMGVHVIGPNTCLGNNLGDVFEDPEACPSSWVIPDTGVVNLLTANQASGTAALGTTAGFVASSACTIASDSGVLEITATDAYPGVAVSGYFSVTPGEMITLYSTWRPDGASRTVYYVAEWCLNGGWVSSPTVPPGLSVPASGNDVVLQTTIEVPANVNQFQMNLVVTNATASETFKVSSLGIWKGTGGKWQMPRPLVSGARDETEGALASLITQLASLGLITDLTTAT
jgi:parallel beta-helix repeat protein